MERLRGHCGQAPSPQWLQTDWILAQFGPTRPEDIEKYVHFVHEGTRLPSVGAQREGQIYLGSEAFVKQMQTPRSSNDPRRTKSRVPSAGN